MAEPSSPSHVLPPSCFFPAQKFPCSFTSLPSSVLHPSTTTSPISADCGQQLRFCCAGWLHWNLQHYHVTLDRIQSCNFGQNSGISTYFLPAPLVEWTFAKREADWTAPISKSIYHYPFKGWEGLSFTYTKKLQCPGDVGSPADTSTGSVMHRKWKKNDCNPLLVFQSKPEVGCDRCFDCYFFHFLCIGKGSPTEPIGEFPSGHC